MTRLFSTQLSMYEGDWKCLANFIQEQDIPLDLQPNCKNFKRMEGDTSFKDFNCLADGRGRHFTSKESAHSHIHAAHSLSQAWWLLPMCYFQNWEAFRKHLGSIHGAGLDMSYGHGASEAK